MRAIAVAVAVAAAFAAGPATADAVDDIMTAAQQRDGIPGLALLVMRHGQVARIGTYGYANVEHHVPVSPGTMFQSGSLGKQFTAAAVLLLAERGKLALGDRIDKYLPAGPKGWEAITIRHLLDHTSGIRDSEGSPPIFDYRRDYSDDEIIRLAQSYPLEFPIGSRWKYNNTGYILAGIIVTRVTGMFYGDFLTREFFQPLGMRTARVISDTDIVANRAAGYVRTATGIRNQDFVAPTLNATADGSLYLSLEDWRAWIEALDREAVLSRASFETLWGTDKHGYGWDHATVSGHAVLEFDGSWQGFRTAIERDPASQLTVVVLANLAEAGPDRIAREVIATTAGFARP